MDLTQGSYFSLLYENTEEFVEIVAAFFDAGLRNNECCLWGVSGQFDTDDAKTLLKDAGIDVDKYLENGQLIISTCNECYIAGEGAVSEMDLNKWEDLYDIALADGYDGLRVVDKFTVVGQDAWKNFVEYENRAVDLIRMRKIVAIFAFLLEARSRSEIVKIISMHDGTIIRQNETWTLLQSSSSCKTIVKEVHFPDDMLENVWTGVWAVDRNDNIVYFNKGMESISGLSKSDVLGRKLASFIPRHTEQDEPGFVDVFHMAKESLHSRSYDVFPFVKPDGQFIYHSGFLVPLINDNGNYAGMLGTVGKLVEQKIDHKLLKDKFRSMEKLEDIYKKSPVIAFLWSADDDWPIVFVSENVTQFGYDPAELVSGTMTYSDIIYPDDLEHVKNDVFQLEIEGKMFFSKEYRVVTKSGEPRWVTERSYLIRNENGKPAYYQGIVIDIDDRKKAENAALEAEKKYRLIFENSPFGVFHFDEHGIVTHCNEKFLDIMHLKKEGVIGFNILASITDENMKKAVSDVFSRKVGHFEGAYHTVTSDITIYIKADYSPNIAEDGTFLGGIGVFVDISERMKTEEKLLKSEALLTEVSNIAKIGGWEFEASTGKGTWTPEIARIHELDPLTSTDVELGLSFYSPDSRKLIEKAVSDAVQKGISYDLELEMITAKGTHKWVRTIGKPTIKGGKVVNVTGALQDITERKKAEEAVHDAEKKYRLIFENSPIGIFHFNADGIVTHCNEKFLQIIGLENKEDIIGFNMVTEIVDRGMKTAVDDVFSRKTGHYEGKYHTVISGKDVYLKADYSPNIADDGTFLGGIGIFGDISVRKKAEEALRLDESRLEALWKINQLSDASLRGIADFVQEEAVRLTQSKIGYLAFLNNESTVLTVYSWSKNIMDECKVRGKRLEYPLDETGLWGEPIREKKPLIINDFVAPNPKKHGYPEGHINLHRYMSIPIFDGKKVVGSAGVGNKEEDYDKADVRQLTLFMEGMWRMIQRKKAEETLREYADKLASANEELSKANAELSAANEELKSLDRMKDDFLSNVSHEFKTPLTSIQGYSQLIADETLGTVNGQQKKAVDTVIRNSERLRRLVDSLLYLSRAQSGKLNYSFELLDLGDIIDNSMQDLELQAESKNITLVKDVKENLPVIKADRDKMMDVFVNLIDNAVKFTPSGGKVTVSAHTSEDSVYVNVEDTGIGIPEDKIPKLFERFYQVDSSVKRRYGGTGLGLYICKTIVEDHKGDIYVTSAVGKGTIMHVRLPLEQ